MDYKLNPITVEYFKLPYLGDAQFEIDTVSSLDNATEKSIVFYSGNDVDVLKDINAGIVICNELLKDKITTYISKALVFSSNPKFTFIKLLEDFFNDSFKERVTLENNTIDGKISDSAYIEKGVEIGKQCEIYPGTYISHATKIGNNCQILSGTVIGVPGLGDLWHENEYHKFTHIGRVVVGANVSIGANVSVMRGMLEDTVIGAGTKIANNVNIGHSVVIGNNCYISSGVTIGGACIIEDNVWIAPGSTLVDHVCIGENTMVATGAVIIKDALPNSTYLGNPARKIGDRSI